MSLGSSEKPLEVLLVEDNPGDARLTQEAIKDSEYEASVTLAEDGEEAMAILRKEGAHSEAATPDLVLLDLRLPKKDGQEVLAEMFDDESLKSIPVFILTGTEAEQALLSSYNIPPMRYSKKPLDVRRLDTVVRQLRVFSQQPIEIPGRRRQSKSSGGKRWWWPFG